MPSGSFRSRDPEKDAKVTGNRKVGAKVTIQYQMKATSIEAKEEAKKGKK